MKYKIISIAVLFAAIHPALSKPKELSSQIREVTVFYQGAQISRITEDISIPAGQTVLLIKGLEQSLQENSLRIGIKGSAKILNVVTSMDYLDQQVSNDKIETLKAQLAVNKDQIESLKVKIKVYEQENALMVSNMKLGGANTGVEVTQIKEGAAFYRARLMEIENSMLETRHKIRDIEEENRKLQSQLTEWNYKKNRPTRRVEVTVEMTAQGTCGILMDYIVLEAGWRPSYDLRIDEVGDPVQISRKATIWQSTGEEWNQILLSFSTGNPMEQHVLPVLNPWYVDFISPRQSVLQMKRSPSRSSKAVMEQRSARAISQPVAESMAIDDEYDMSGIAVDVYSNTNNSIQEFSLQTPASISNDGKEYVFALGNDQLLADYHYQSIPKKEKAAYLVATLTDWEGYELVDGEANIYYEQMFIGETYLSTQMTLDSIQLSMGKDKGLIVDRKMVKDYTRTRTVGSNIRKSFGHEIILRNTKPVAVNVIVEDQMPVSSNSQITIEEEDIGNGIREQATGKITWRFSLKPGETVNLPLRYSVKYPKGTNIAL